MAPLRFGIPQGGSYEDICARFRWDIPDRFNIGVEICDAHADGTNRPALITDDLDGPARTWSFDEMKALSNQVANMLAAHGVVRGDRVGILLPQRVETALAHIAVYKLGAIALPLFTQFGPDSLEHRLAHSGARALITDSESLANVQAIQTRLLDLETIFVVDGAHGRVDFWSELARASDAFTPVRTWSDTPALIIYTSGAMGRPKGALHGHRALLGQIPGMQFSHDLFPQPADRFWTQADWAWGAGLLGGLLPSLYFGVPVVAHRARRFDPGQVFDMMARHAVRNVLLPPTALRLMRDTGAASRRHGLRSVASGGETLGDDVVEWCRETFGLDVNDCYGQTEANLVVGNCHAVYPGRSGSIGRAIPGHDVAVVSPEGSPMGTGEQGIIAIRAPDPSQMLRYWNDDHGTAAKYAGPWLLTGDLGTKDRDGYLWFAGRDDDVISSGGYRIGPADIEACIARHPAVLRAAAIGAPDAVRGQVVKAFVQLRPGMQASVALAAEITAMVRTRLAAYQHPREIEFIDDLPMTAAGVPQRAALRARVKTPATLPAASRPDSASAPGHGAAGPEPGPR
jgi:acetyl-CoA synthetase